MTITGEGGAAVAPPRCQPRPYGLLSVAERDPRGDFEFAKGLEYDLLPCGPARVVSGQCAPVLTEHTKTAERGYATPVEALFTVYAGWECSPGATVREAWANAEAILEQGWEQALEAAFWTGEDQAANALGMSLAGGTPDAAEDLTPAAGALSVVEGVAVLESYAAGSFSCRPTIHANAGLSAYMSSKGLLRVEGGHLETWAGSFVALGGGYGDSGPGGDDPAEDEAWIYVSGPVRVTYSPVFHTPRVGDEAGAVDRAVNDARAFAERTVSVGVGCGLAAVRVELAA